MVVQLRAEPQRAGSVKATSGDRRLGGIDGQNDGLTAADDSGRGRHGGRTIRQSVIAFWSRRTGWSMQIIATRTAGAIITRGQSAWSVWSVGLLMTLPSSLHHLHFHRAGRYPSFLHHFFLNFNFNF